MSTNQKINLPVASIDAFFVAQAAMLRAKGYWSQASEFKNHNASIEMVATPGEQPREDFSGYRACANVIRLEVREYHEGEIRMTAQQGTSLRDGAPKEIMSIVEFEANATEILEKWFVAFLKYSKQFSTLK